MADEPKNNLSNIKYIDNYDKDKIEIINRFLHKVKGKKPDTSTNNARHDGKEGHWLETQMGITHNAKNEPDLFGYELKNETSSKTTFGDWSANYYIFNDSTKDISRDDFLRIFGKPNEKKGGRYSWSGEPIPKIDKFSSYGQKIFVDKSENIVIVYNYFKDQRINKKIVVPAQIQTDNVVIALWNKDSIKPKVENKFNKSGWFTCIKNNEGIYSEIFFGPPISWDSWISDVKKGLIFFDSGMYQGNPRPYSQWRANNKYWESHRYNR